MYAYPRTLAALCAVIALFTEVPAYAFDRQNVKEWEAIASAKIKPDDAARIAQRVIPDGKLVDVDVETIKGVVTYAIEIEKDGRLRTVLVDLQTGEVLTEVREDDGDVDGDEDDDDDDN
jgi:uncharacterized membrane protein YkoI